VFTGIVQEIGKIRQIKRLSSLATLVIESLDLFERIEISDSVSVNGVCLTLVKKERGLLFFEVVSPTLKSTNLKRAKIGEAVNLEAALKVGDTLGGHFVLGHIDKELKLKRVTKRGKYFQFEIDLPKECKKYIVDKGSIAIDGISLTIKSMQASSLTLDIIPFTWAHTTLKNKRSGQWLNIEFDYLLKSKQKQ
jgi:riboflavin synthase